MNKICKLMQPLNNAEKRAVEVHRMLTHAYYVLPRGTSQHCGNILLTTRHDGIQAIENSKRRRLAWDIANQIEQLMYKRWVAEAIKAGHRK